MGRRSRWLAGAWIVAAALSAGALARAEGAGMVVGLNPSDMKLGPTSGMPACATSAVAEGDSGTGPSIALAKTAAGCSVPWHRHTSTEHLMVVSGVLQLETKSGKALTLEAGGFAKLPAHHVHAFRCGKEPCTLYIHSDGAYDIHYVDAKGAELKPADALKAVGEAPAAAP